MPRRLVSTSMVLALVAGLALVGCGGDDGSPTTGTTVAAGLDETAPPTTASDDGNTSDTETTATPSGPDPTDQPDNTLNDDVTAAPAQLNEAFARGYTDTCNEVWSVSSSGLVYDPDDPGYGYPIEECLDYLDETLGEFEDTIEEAYDAGRAEAELIAESITFSGLLCNESLEQCWQVP